jgi:hypothetical protein
LKEIEDALRRAACLTNEDNMDNFKEDILYKKICQEEERFWFLCVGILDEGERRRI